MASLFCDKIINQEVSVRLYIECDKALSAHYLVCKVLKCLCFFNARQG